MYRRVRSALVFFSGLFELRSKHFLYCYGQWCLLGNCSVHRMFRIILLLTYPLKCVMRYIIELSRYPEECKSKWRNIRDNYMKNKKKKITGSATSYSKYDDERLNFLSESQDEGESSGTYIVDNATHDPIEISFECVKEEFDSSEDVPLSESPFVIGTSSSSNAEQPTTYTSIPTIVSATYDASQSLAAPQNFPVLEQNVIPPPKRPMKRKIDSIIDELKKDREERNVILQQLVTKATCPTGKSPIHNFFSSMADIVCNFPPAKIAEVRMKVCTMISDVEISVLRDRSQSGGSS